MSIDFSSPLVVDEVIACLLDRWKVTYDMQLVVRRKKVYLHVMWAYLEQQSFPLDEDSYRAHLGQVLEVINRLGLANEVREWLANTPQKPRLGKALSLPLKATNGLEEFLL